MPMRFHHRKDQPSLVSTWNLIRLSAFPLKAVSLTWEIEKLLLLLLALLRISEDQTELLELLGYELPVDRLSKDPL